MLQFIGRRWFLISLAFGVLLAWFAPTPLVLATAWLDPRLIVFPCLYLMAWTLPSRSILRAIRRPWPALWAVFVSYSIVPLTALVIVAIIPNKDLRIGLYVAASVPCTLASAVIWTRMARGDEATALLTLMISSCLSWLATTAWLTWLTQINIAVETTRMMQELLLTIVLPLALGQICRLSPKLAGFADQHKIPLSITAQVLVLIMIWKACGTVGLRLNDQQVKLPPLLLVISIVAPVTVHLISLAIGWWSSSLIGFSRPECSAIAIACSQKTLPVAVLLFDRFYSDDYPLAVLPIAFYHFEQLLVDTYIAERLAKGNSPPIVVEPITNEPS